MRLGRVFVNIYASMSLALLLLGLVVSGMCAYLYDSRQGASWEAGVGDRLYRTMVLVFAASAGDSATLGFTNCNIPWIVELRGLRLSGPEGSIRNTVFTQHLVGPTMDFPQDGIYVVRVSVSPIPDEYTCPQQDVDLRIVESAKKGILIRSIEFSSILMLLSVLMLVLSRNRGWGPLGWVAGLAWIPLIIPLLSGFYLLLVNPIDTLVAHKNVNMPLEEWVEEGLDTYFLWREIHKVFTPFKSEAFTLAWMIASTMLPLLLWTASLEGGLHLFEAIAGFKRRKLFLLKTVFALLLPVLTVVIMEAAAVAIHTPKLYVYYWGSVTSVLLSDLILLTVLAGVLQSTVLLLLFVFRRGLVAALIVNLGIIVVFLTPTHRLLSGRAGAKLTAELYRLTESMAASMARSGVPLVPQSFYIALAVSLGLYMASYLVYARLIEH